MIKGWKNILKQTKVATLCAMMPWLVAAGFLFTASDVLAAGNPMDYCDVKESTPDLTTTAHCAKESCETKKGCLDPAPVKPANRFSSTPGQRSQSYGADGKPVGSTGHKGNDIAAPMGAPIYAGGDGKISVVRYQMNEEKNTGWGNYVQIDHADGTITRYAHMSCFANRVYPDGTSKKIQSGDAVKQGQVIGFVGMTGGTSGPHLHYEILKGGVAFNATLQENANSGMLCEIPDEFVKAGLSPDAENAAKTDTPTGGIDNCGSASGCAKMYPADSISDLHHKYESGGNPCAFNNCVAGDIGGCSYGSSQLECTQGSLKTYLTTLQKQSPQIWTALGGGTVEQMNERACAAPATEFANKWKAICKTDLSADFSKSQESYMQATYYDAGVKKAISDFGIDFNARSPELQMALYSAGVAMGSPGGVGNLLKSVKDNIGDPASMSDEELLKAMYTRRDHFYGSSSQAIRESVQKRNANEGSEALESLKIRKAWEEEQKKTPHKTYEEVVKEVTGRDACADGKSATFNCSASGATGGSASSTDTEGTRPDKNCAPSQYSASMKTCMFCPLFKVIFDTASLMAKLTFDKLAIPVMSVVLVAWAIWVAITILKFVSSVTTKDAPTMIKELLGKSFVVLIVVLFLQADSSTFFQMALEPIFNTGFKLAQLAVADGACTEEFDVLKNGGLPPSMGNSILCTIKAIQDRLVDTMALGSASMCVGFYIKGKLFIFGSFAYVITGLLIWGGCLVLMVIFPFLMLDSIFQLTVSCALLPAAIGAYPFKLTNKYVKKVWDSFINAMFNFIFLSIIILILTTAIEQTLSDAVYNSIDRNNMDETYMDVIVNALAWSGIALLQIVFVLLLGWAVLDEASEFASDFAGGITKGGIGSAVGGLAASGAKNLGAKAWESAKTVGSAVGENVKESVGDWNRERKMNNLTRNAQVSTDENGNKIYTSTSKSWFRGRNKTNQVVVAANGAKMLTTTKDYGNGRVVTTKSDGFLKQTEVVENGKVVGGELSITSAGLKSIRNKDGTMNTTALDATLRGSAFDEKIVKAAALQQYAMKSFPGYGKNFNHVGAAGKFNGSLENADITLSKDENGNEVLQVVEKNEDGSSQIMRMTMGENSRPLVEVENVYSNGESDSRATDGMFNRRKSVRLDSKTKEPEESVEYSVSDFYNKQTVNAVNDRGEFAAVFTNGVESAFSKEEQDRIKAQFVNDRRKNRKNTIAGIV